MDHMPYQEKHQAKNQSIEELKAKGYFDTKKLPNGSIQAESVSAIEETTSEGSLIFPPKE